MLEKIKKHKIILTLLFFVIFILLFNNKVNGATEQFTYNYNNIDYTIKFDNDGSVNTYFVICNKNTGIPERFIYHYANNSFKYYYNENGNLVIQKMNNDAYFYLNPKKTGNNEYLMQWGGFTRADLTIDLNKSAICYTNKPIVHKDTAEEYDKFPKWHIEYYEPFGKYYAFTDWYDIRKISITQFYAYGDHLSYNGDFYNIDDYWDWEGEVTEMKEDNECIERTGFPLNVYGHYSYLQLDLNDHTYVLDGLDFTEETLKGSQYEDCLNPLTHLNLYLDERTGTPTVYSNYIDNDLLEDYYFALGEKDTTYFFQISFDGGNTYNYIHIDCKEEKEINGKKYTRFYYKLFANGTYTFKLTIYRNVGIDKDKFDKYEVIKTFTITSYEEIIDKNGNDTTSATPFITAYSDGDILRFSTQTLYDRATKYYTENPVEELRYKAYYIDENSYQLFGDNYSSWILMDTIYEGYDFTIKTSPYHFETQFSYENINDGDKFYFVFFDEKLGSWSNVTTYVIESKVDIYTTSQNITFNNDKFQRLYDFFYKHFGFLTYPLEFIINLLNRVLNINYSEPIIHIPTLYVPGTNNKIFNGYEFNFNSLLQNKAVANIYNIYLVAVDFCIVIAFILHAKKVAEEVFTKNG